MIYQRENESVYDTKEIMCETQADNIEDKFLKSLSEKICEILNTNYNDRRNMINLLNFSLKEFVTGYKKGLLWQYEQYLFDEAIKRLREKFNLKSDVNYNYALHARFADIVDELNKKMVTKNED